MFDYTYKIEDTVVFNVGGKEYVYRVKSQYLHYKGGTSNETIFEELGIIGVRARTDFCTQVYGYEARDGMCPECKFEDMVALNSLIQALKEKCEGFVTKKKKRFEIGDFLYSRTSIGAYSRKVGTIVEVADVKSDDLWYYDLKGKTSFCSKIPKSDHFRYATEGEILASKYAEKYKSIIRDNPKKSVNYEVQSKIKTNSSGHRGEAINPRRRSIKVTSSSGLVGNTVKAVTRRSKIGISEIGSSLLIASRH